MYVGGLSINRVRLFFSIHLFLQDVVEDES